MQKIAWDDFRLVRAIADTRSLGGAAETLDVNNSTVFRRLNALEEQLGVRLFERARSGYVLTSAGEEMVALAGRMAESIIDFERKIAGQDVRPSGELRVTTTDSMFRGLVAPHFAAFHAKYPEIQLEFIIENRPLNLSRRDADVAIRAAMDPPETLVGRRIGTLSWSAYATAACLERHSLDPAQITDILAAGVPWIGMSYPLQSMTASRWLDDHVPTSSIVARVSSVSGVEDAVVSGLGLGLLPCFMGSPNPDLVRIKVNVPSESGLWILTHADLKKAARVRAFLDFYGQELSRQKKLLEGE